jgi:ferric-dicitrate binding protein FerR (iron transport regulator)
MNQYEFDKLLEKYLAGDTTLEEENLIRQWSDRVLDGNSGAIPPEEQETIKKRIWKRLRTNVMTSRPFIGWANWAKLGIAASVVAALIGTLYVYNTSSFLSRLSGEVTEARGAVEVINTSDKPQKVILKDGSTVVLKQHSSISYPEPFGIKNRTVFLKGEAFFQVKKDSSNPFIVHAGELVTQVLGTSFTVKSYEACETIEVVVATGSVSVYEKQEKSLRNRNGIILTPNQKITFDKKSQKITAGLVEKPAIAAPLRPEAKKIFVFDETSLAQVLATLKKAYGIDILVENDGLNACRITADLNNLSLYTQLDLICKSINANYERRGTTLFIQGVGCKQ